MIKTRFTKLVGASAPIQVASMPGVSTPALVAAVADAGAVGMFGASGMPAPLLEADLEQIAKGTSGVFGVNFLMPFLDRAWTWLKELFSPSPPKYDEEMKKYKLVDTDGVPVNFKVLRGTKDEDFIDELINRLEKMPEWKPALLNDKPVPKKMVQTITIEIPETATAGLGG